MRRLASGRGTRHIPLHLGAAYSTSTTSGQQQQPPPSFFSSERIRETASFSRWKAIVPSVASHLCIGAPYAWSVFGGSLQRNLGVVAAAGNDRCGDGLITSSISISRVFLQLFLLICLWSLSLSHSLTLSVSHSHSHSLTQPLPRLPVLSPIDTFLHFLAIILADFPLFVSFSNCIAISALSDHHDFAADDWTMAQVVPVISAVFALQVCLSVSLSLCLSVSLHLSVCSLCLCFF
jgi:hypothetical protein